MFTSRPQELGRIYRGYRVFDTTIGITLSLDSFP